MKKCVKCNTKYTDDVKFCSSCGSKLEKIDLKKEKDNSKTGNVLRYVFGGIIILVNLMRIEDIGLIAILGFIFAISIFPLPYDLIFKKKEETKKTKFLLSLILPIVLGLVWLIIVPAEKLKEITINNLKDPIAVNETVQIDFDTNLTNIEGKKFKYESSNPEIAIINEKGEITGIADGTVTITISGENDIKTDKEVTIKYIEIDTIELAGDTQVEVGTTGKLTYSTSPEKVSDKIVRWESSNPEIVSVNEKGEITGVSQGKVTISAISEKEKRGEVEVQSYIKVESLTISNESLRIEKTKTAQLSVGIVPENADNSGITWSSSNPKVATVNENGLVTAVDEGTATITAKSGNGVKATSSIEVFEVKPESITLNKTSLSLSKGGTATVSATVAPNNASDRSVRWSSSNITVASVDNGVITATGRGTATITATTSNGKTATVSVTVTEKSPVTIKNFRYSIDYVCGVEWTFSITNNSSKQINYVTLKWYNFNSVGDYVYDSIDGKNYTALKYTGPLKPGANSGSKRNTTKFYNCSYSSSTISEIIVDFADGTSQTIKNSEFSQYTGITG